jgi:hypothetical protein
MFPVRYELDFYILFTSNSVFKWSKGESRLFIQCVQVSSAHSICRHIGGRHLAAQRKTNNSGQTIMQPGTSSKPVIPVSQQFKNALQTTEMTAYNPLISDIELCLSRHEFFLVCFHARDSVPNNCHQILTRFGIHPSSVTGTGELFSRW